MSEMPPGLCLDLEYHRGTWTARLYGTNDTDVRVEIPFEVAIEFEQRKLAVDDKMIELKKERQQIIHEFMEKVWEMIEE